MNAYIISQIAAQLAKAQEEYTAATIARDMANQSEIEANHRRQQLETALITIRQLTELGVRITDD